MATYREVYSDRVDKAETDEEIKQAYQEMIKDSDGNVDLVNQNLGYILDYYNDTKKRDHWYRLLFGRGLQVSPEEALEKGKAAASR